MNKAFVKESDEGDNEVEIKREASPSGKNYITPLGFKRLEDEYRELKYKERPEVTRVVSWAAGNGDRSENGDYIYGKKRLREIDRRLRFLSKRIDIAEIVDPQSIKSEEILFGASVVIKNEDGVEKRYSIVGTDEIDASKGKISWISPLARALFKKRVGDVIEFSSPGGMRELEVILIEYIPIL